MPGCFGLYQGFRTVQNHTLVFETIFKHERSTREAKEKKPKDDIQKIKI